MTYCLNSLCTRPQNPQGAKFCQHCGAALVLAHRFQAIKPLGRSGRSLLAHDQQLPSRPPCVLVRLGDDALDISPWDEAQLLRLEALSNLSFLPRILAVVQADRGIEHARCAGHLDTKQQAQFLVREWIDGPSLAEQVAEQGVLSEPQVIDVMLQVLKGLDYLHQQHVIHGKISPQTLVWSVTGLDGAQSGLELMLISYGGMLRSLAQSLSATDQGVQDLHSLGLTAIELLTGETLCGLNDNHGASVSLALEEHWKKYAQIPVSEGFKLILHRLVQGAGGALQLDADHRRYRTASEAADALQGLALSPLTRSEGTLKLVAQRLACAPAAALPPDFSMALPPPPPPPLRAGEHKARAADALQSGQFQAVGTSVLVAAVLANPKQLPLGKLIEKIGQHQGRTNPSPSPPEVMWQQLESLRSQGYGAADLAEGWLELAQFYGQQVQQGHRSLINIVIAIAAYEQALSHIEAAPIAYDHLGRLYWILSRQEPKSRLRCLETAIRVYQRGASLAASRPVNLGHKREVTPATHPEIQQAIEPEIQPEINLALLHNHLGEALNDLAALTGQPDEWQQAIQAYETALTSLSLKTAAGSNAVGSNAAGSNAAGSNAARCSHSSTEEVALEARLLGAEIQNNLGTACWNLAQHQPKDAAIELLQRAIAAYNQAAQLYDPDDDAIRYGMIQNNLGTTYLNLGQLEQSLDLLRLATGTYQVALIYRSRNEAPLSHAATQNNLGAACIQLAGHPYLDPIAARESLEQAIVAYKEALMLIKELSEVGVHNAGFDPAISRLNLGLAHQRIGTLTEDIQATGIQLVYLETAIRCYLELLNQEPKGSEIYSLGLEYLNQIFEYLSNEVGLPLEHPLLKLLPNHLFRE